MDENLSLKMGHMKNNPANLAAGQSGIKHLIYLFIHCSRFWPKNE